MPEYLYVEVYWGCVGNVYHKNDFELIKEYGADLLLVLGSSMSCNSCKCFEELFSNAKIIHVDIDKEQFGRYREANAYVNSDIRNFVDLLETIKPIERKKKLRSRTIVSQENADSIIAKSFNFIDKISKEDIYIVPDAGNHWLDVLYWCNPKKNVKIITNNGLASMGYAIGASVGMAIAQKGKVICFTGDGSLLMSGGEISAAVNENVDIIFVVLNNQALGRVYQYQISNRLIVSGSIISNVSILKIAEGMGAKAYSCDSVTELESILTKCIEEHGVHVVEVLEDKTLCPTMLKT